MTESRAASLLSLSLVVSTMILLGEKRCSREYQIATMSHVLWPCIMACDPTPMSLYKFDAVRQEGFLNPSPRRLSIRRFLSKALVGEHRALYGIMATILTPPCSPDILFALHLRPLGSFSSYKCFRACALT